MTKYTKIQGGFYERKTDKNYSSVVQYSRKIKRVL
jgi:hypothetical protein